jgi:hypothetical protein
MYILADSPALPGYIFIPRSIFAVDIFMVREPLQIRVTYPLPGNGQAGTYISRRCPGIYNLSFYNLRYQLLPGYLFIPRSIVAVFTEPLPSYQQFLIAGFRGYESCTCCLATVKLEHTYFLRYFGPLGRMPHFSLLIIFLIFIQSGKKREMELYHSRKDNYAGNAHIHTFTFI